MNAQERREYKLGRIAELRRIKEEYLADGDYDEAGRLSGIIFTLESDLGITPVEAIPEGLEAWCAMFDRYYEGR